MAPLTRHLAILLIASTLIFSSGFFSPSPVYAATRVGGQFQIWGGFFHLLGGFLRFFNPNSACPEGTGYADGCTGAQASGSVQHKNFFTSYVPVNGNAPSVFETYSRPSWNVAGVDYAVGYSGALADPTTGGGSNLPSCATLDHPSTYRVTINSTPCTLDHLDFSANGAVCVHIANGLSGNVTFTNDKFDWGVDNGSGCFSAGEITEDGSTNINLLVKYSEFDNSCATLYPTLTESSCIGSSDIYAQTTGGSVTLEYSAMLMPPGGDIEALAKSGTLTITNKYNYWEGNGGLGYGSAAAPDIHADMTGMLPSVGATITETDQYILAYLPPWSCCGTAMLSPTPQVASGTMGPYTIDHDVIAARFYGPGSVCGQPPNTSCEYGPAANLIYAYPGGATLTNVIFTNNYIDYTGTGQYLSNPGSGSGIFYGGGHPNSSTCTGNINLIGGGAVTGNLGDGTWVCS
jgi:hypothetical protein